METELANGQQENQRLTRAGMDLKLQVANNKVIADRVETDLTIQRDNLQAEVLKQREELLAQRHLIQEHETALSVQSLQVRDYTERVAAAEAQVAFLTEENEQLTESKNISNRLMRKQTMENVDIRDGLE